MTIWPIDPALAARAHALKAQGLKGKAIAEALGVKASEANILASVGYAQIAIERPRLTPPELKLVRAIAAVHRKNVADGITRMVTTKEVAKHCRMGRGWPAATARKRLQEQGPWTPDRTFSLGLVNARKNGYIELTEPGWALVHALEAAEAERAPVLDYARERFRQSLEDLLDDPSGVAEGGNAAVQEVIGENRHLATALGVDYDALIDTLGSDFERERLAKIEAWSAEPEAADG